ncbi:MAG: ferredoxin family protein [Tannerellaceae bacterium]|jgi:NAD-dependent dihydropyrimidine dehydrogenase PreA subunit|nr:ferredoxin family protein [Tannerellaceae bacterium]
MRKESITTIAATMQKAGYKVVVVPDLCRKVMESSPDMPEIAGGAIIACHPRALTSLLDGLGLESARIEDLRSNSAEDILAAFGLPCSDTTDSEEKERWRKTIGAFPVENGTDAWYPVIDKSRCVECGKCHDFCLFGVYAMENKRVRVVQPQKCKNNCPACARMCPGKAIIFPKYEKSPINGGTAEEETYHPEEMERMYREKLQMRLQQRRASVSLLKGDGK